MNSLLSYGSDDDYDDSSEEKLMFDHQQLLTGLPPLLKRLSEVRTVQAGRCQLRRSPDEPKRDALVKTRIGKRDFFPQDSGDESKPTRDSSKRQSRDRDDHHREDSRRYSEDSRRYSNDSPKSRDDHRSRKDRSDRKDEKYVGRNNRDRDEDRSRNKESSSREEERTRDRYRSDKDEDRRGERRGKSRERYSNSSSNSRDDRYRDSRDRKDDSRDRKEDSRDRKEDSRDRKERDKRRSRSPRDRDRRRSKSPRRSDRSKSRSRSKDRSGRGGYSKRYERASSKMERLDKMGIEIKSADCHSLTASDFQKSMGEVKNDPKDRFFVPGITGRFREQIEKRKLLWQKKEPEKQDNSAVPAPSGLGSSRSTKVWEGTTFAQDTDGKVANKFKRLMGIKNAGEGSNTAVDVLKKQEEMFSSMEQQYEVARTATHTMRGVGLGFGSYQR